MMKAFIVLTTLLGLAYSQAVLEESPKPYSFSYTAVGEEGTSSHSETADGSGTVRGTYTLSDADGRNRVVEYVAGAEGFVANVRTNEPGTDNAAPAGVTIESSADGAKALLNTAAVRLEPKPVPARPVGRPTGVRYVLVPAQ